MKYNAPYGMEATPDAPYINGNPSTGTMGSIPPAASIEFPQREIVEVISKAGIAPDNADLTQLRKALQYVDVFNKWKFSTNSGTASQWSATVPTLPLMPPPTGTAIWFKPGLASINGGTVFSVNGSSFTSVVCADLTPIAIGDVTPSAWLLLYFDGTHWQALVGLTRQFGALPLLTSNALWYVNGTTGDDTNYDGTLATHTAGTAHGPFKTLQRASNEVLKYNMNGYDQVIYVADGTYASVVLNPQNGAGTVHLVGNDAAPQNCIVTATAANTHAIFQNGGIWTVRGFRVSATGSGTCDGFANNYGHTQLMNMRFGPCVRGHITAGWNGTVILTAGPTPSMFTIEAGATAQAHMLLSFASNIAIDPYNIPNLQILGAVNLAQFCWAAQLGVIQVIYTALTGKAFVHGQQYYATGNSIITAIGGGASYFPGDSAGTLSYGGQYIP